MSAELALQGLLAMNNSQDVLSDGYEVEAVLYSRVGPDGRTEYQIRKTGSSSNHQVVQIDPALDGGQAALEAYLASLDNSSHAPQTNGIPASASSSYLNSIPVPSADMLVGGSSSVTTSPLKDLFGTLGTSGGGKRKRPRFSETSMNLPNVSNLSGVDKLNALLAKYNRDNEESEDEERGTRSTSAPLAPTAKRSRFGGRITPRAPPVPPPAQRSAAMQDAAERVRRHTARYVCQMCGRDFTRKANLTSHVQTHLNIRPFQCDRCPRSFVRRHELKRHTALHEASADGQVRWGGMRPKRSKHAADDGEGEVGELGPEGELAVQEAVEGMEALDKQHEEAIAAVAAAEPMAE